MSFILKKEDNKTNTFTLLSKNDKKKMEIEEENEEEDYIKFFRNSIIHKAFSENYILYKNGTSYINIGEKKLNLPISKTGGIKIVKKIECGENHMIILFEDGTIYSYGDNTWGQCGIEVTKKKITELIEINNINIKGQKIDNIYCSMNTSFFLIDHKLYSCGKNELGSLGRPCEIGYDYNIISIHTSTYGVYDVYTSRDVNYIFILTWLGGDYFIWGFGDNKKNFIKKNSVLEMIQTPIIISYMEYIIPPKEIKKIKKIVTFKDCYMIISELSYRELIIVGLTNHLYNSISSIYNIKDIALNKNYVLFFTVKDDDKLYSYNLLVDKKQPEYMWYKSASSIYEDKKVIALINSDFFITYLDENFVVNSLTIKQNYDLNLLNKK